jgi:hypothetical protein
MVISIALKKVALVTSPFADDASAELLLCALVFGSYSPSCLRSGPSLGSRNISKIRNASVPMTRAPRFAGSELRASRPLQRCSAPVAQCPGSVGCRSTELPFLPPARNPDLTLCGTAQGGRVAMANRVAPTGAPGSRVSLNACRALDQRAYGKGTVAFRDFDLAKSVRLEIRCYA